MGAFRLQVRVEKAASEKDGPVKEKAEPEKAKERTEKRALINTQGAHSVFLFKMGKRGPVGGLYTVSLDFSSVAIDGAWASSLILAAAG